WPTIRDLPVLFTPSSPSPSSPRVLLVPGKVGLGWLGPVAIGAVRAELLERAQELDLDLGTDLRVFQLLLLRPVDDDAALEQHGRHGRVPQDRERRRVDAKLAVEQRPVLAGDRLGMVQGRGEAGRSQVSADQRGDGDAILEMRAALPYEQRVALEQVGIF